MGVITSNVTADLLIFVTFVISIIYLYLTRNCNYWKKRGVEEISSSVFTGFISMIFARKTPHEYLLDIYRMTGEEKFVGFHVLDKPYLMIRDPELIRHIFIKDFSNFSNKLISSSKGDVFGSANLFLVKNPPWKYIRQKLSPVYTTGKIRKLFDLMLEICKDLQTHLKCLGIDDKIGKPVDAKELPAIFTTDLIGVTAFGLKLNSLNDPNAEFRKAGRNMYMTSYIRYLEWLAILFIPQLRTFIQPTFFDRKGTDYLRNSFWQTIDERKKSGIRRNDVIDSLIDMKNIQDNDLDDMYKLEGDQLVAQASIFFSGGFETSSTTTTWALYELAKNPEIQNRLRDEINEASDNDTGSINYDKLVTLSYLDMFVHEILRMYPILPWLDRVPDVDYTIPGTTVKITKGIPFILPMRMLHMDPKYFPDPEKCIPERFSEENKKNIIPFTYFPFGEGPRSCIGSRLGLLQTKLGLVQFIHKYEITPSKKTPVPVRFNKFSAFIQPAGYLYLNFRKISN